MKKRSFIAIIIVVLLLVVLGLFFIMEDKQMPTCTGEGWLNVVSKYEQNGIYYLVIPTAGYGNQPVEVTKEIYGQVVCSEKVLYHVKYAYYDDLCVAKILEFDLNDKLDSR